MFDEKLVLPFAGNKSELEGYSDLYSNIQSEISKQAQPIPEPIIWSGLKVDCTELLGKHVKDLNVAHYLVIATLELDGVTRLQPSLEFLCQFIENNSKQMRPSVLKTNLRKKSVTWFLSSLEKYLGKKVKWVSNESGHNEIIVWLERYCDRCSSALGFNVLAPMGIVEKIRSNMISEDEVAIGEYIEQKSEMHEFDNLTDEQLQERTDGVEKNGEVSVDKVHLDHSRQTPLSQKNDLSAVSKNDDDLGEYEVLRVCRTQLMVLADNKLKESIHEPSSYYFRRVAAWITMSQLPESNISNETQLKAPSQADKKYLNIALQAADDIQVVLIAESMLDRFPLWLDANIFTINALKKRDSQYTLCINTIISTLRSLLDRFPGLRELKFRNGEFMFGVECQKMPSLLLATDSIKNDNTEYDPTSAEVGSTASIVKSKATASKFNSELYSRQGELFSMIGLRQEYELRVSQIHHCMQYQAFDLAIAQIDYLWSLVKKIEFSNWEPKLASQLIELQLKAIIAKYPSDKEMSSVDKLCCKDLYTHLAGINTCAASEININSFA
ncbi:MAG: TssA family type VI secretion system protein [Thiohalomonadales bacterium]